jgi:uncharacterized membrane protein YeaQ/YmgE (transglycosylase-associated protein family)
MKLKKTNRATEMKREKKIIYLTKILGCTIGGIIGCFIGYQLAQLSNTGASYNNISTLAFFLSLFGAAIGCVSGFAIATSIGQNNIGR